MAISICAHKSATSPTLPGGKTNADGSTTNQLWALLQDAEAKLGTLERDGDRYWINGIQDTDQFSLDVLKFVIGYGAATFGADIVEVHNYPSWLKLDDSVINSAVPDYLGLPEIIDTPAVIDPVTNEETAATVTHKPTYGEMHQVVVREGVTYAAASDGQSYFLGSLLVRLDAEVGVELVLAPPPAPDPGP